MHAPPPENPPAATGRASSASSAKGLAAGSMPVAVVAVLGGHFSLPLRTPI